MAQINRVRLTQAQYARWRKERGLPGSSREAVRKAVDEGRITVDADGLIDPEVADIQWAKNTRARVSPQAAAGSIEPSSLAADLVGQAAAAAAGPPAGAAGAPAPSSGPEPSGYTAARARREAADAEDAEIELRRKKGELVVRKDVDRAFTEIMRELRDGLMATGRRTAAEVATLTSAEACEAVIDREHRILLELLTQRFREKVGAPISPEVAP